MSNEPMSRWGNGAMKNLMKAALGIVVGLAVVASVAAQQAPDRSKAPAPGPVLSLIHI